MPGSPAIATTVPRSATTASNALRNSARWRSRPTVRRWAMTVVMRWRDTTMTGKLGELALDLLRLRPQRWILGEHAENESVEDRRQLDDVSRRRQRMRSDDRMEHRDPGLQRKRLLPRRELVEQRAEREDVGRCVYWQSLRLLGRHVRARADHHAGGRPVMGQRLRVRLFGCCHPRRARSPAPSRTRHAEPSRSRA